MSAISRTVVYGSYTLPNVKTISRNVEPVEFNRTVVAWRESFTLSGLLQANSNADFQTALDAFLAGMKPTNLDQDFTVTVVTDTTTKKRFEYLAASTNTYRRASMSFAFIGGTDKTELSYPYTATFSWYPPNLTGTGGTEVAGSTTTNQKITYAIDPAGYIQITKAGSIITAKGTSSRAQFNAKIAATGYSDDVSSLKITSNLYKRSGYNSSSDKQDTECTYTITEVETPIQIADFEDLRISVTSQEVNGLVLMHVTAEGRILKSKYKQINLETLNQWAYRTALETELKKVVGVLVMGTPVLNRRDPIEWNPQSGRIRIGIHWTFPMGSNWIVAFSVTKSTSQDLQNDFASTNSGYVHAVVDHPLQRVTYSGNISTLAPSPKQALDGLIPVYPSPRPGIEIQEGPLTFSPTEVAQPEGDGYSASASWSITYRIMSGPLQVIKHQNPSTWTGVTQGKSKYV